MPAARLTIWDEAECRRVHEASLEVLAVVGVEVTYEPALALLADAGADVQGTRVRIPAHLVTEALRSAPRGFRLSARGDPAPPLTIRDGEIYFGTGSDVLYVRDPDTGERRRVRRADVRGMAAICEQLPNIDFVMSMGLPEDVPREIDDLAQVAEMLRGTRKPLIVAPRDGSVLSAIQEMATLCGGRDSIAIYAMPSPPLMHDADAMSKVIACARLGIPLIYAPAPSAGATAPRSVTSVVVVGNAEALSGLVVHQLTRSGAPFIYGAGGGALDMRTAIEAYAGAEMMMAQTACCDLARYYGLPSFSYAAESDSKTLDEQWAAEAALTMAYGALSRATLLHDVGYLESGLQSSYESIVLGDELAGHARAFLREVPVDEYAIAMDEIAAIGPGGNFLATKYTRRHTHDFWVGELLDHLTHDRWVAAGGTTLLERVREKVARLRATEGPALTIEQEVGVEAILARALRPGSAPRAGGVVGRPVAG